MVAGEGRSRETRKVAMVITQVREDGIWGDKAMKVRRVRFWENSEGRPDLLMDWI